MKKNWIAAVLCLALSFSMLAGCSKAEEQQTAAPAEEQTVEAQAEEEKPEEEETAEENAQETAEEAPAQVEKPAEAQPQQTAAAQTQPETTAQQAEPAPAEEPAAEQPAAEEPAPEQPAAEEAPAGIANGTYTISIGFSGGTGKASITNPVTLYVKDGSYSAKVVWTSIYYDYMKVGGVKYLNENNGGNSTFTIPVPALDTYFTVIGDTTAMSSPHEIEYTLYFDSSTLK